MADIRSSQPDEAHFWGCVGSWFSGGWYDSGAVNYIQNVQTTLAQRTWLGY